MSDDTAALRPELEAGLGALALVLGIALAFNGASLFTVAASCCAVVLIAEWILL